MSNELLKYIEQLRTTVAKPSDDIPPEILAQIKSMLPPALVAQVSAVPGGLEQLVRQVISQNPALASIMSGDDESDESEQPAAASSPLAGVGSLIDSLKGQLGDLPDDATPQQKNAFYLSIATWLGDQIGIEGSLVSNMFGKFEAQFPNGMTHVEIQGWVDRGKALLKVMGVQKNDSAWVLVRKISGFIDKMQAETQNSRLCRETVASKVTALVRIASECEGGLEGLFETAMESEVLKQLAGKLTGMPLAEVAKDPFAAASKVSSGGGGGFDLSSMSSMLGMLGGGSK